MNARSGSWPISILLLVTGFAATFIEILAVRILTPYFGATVMLWCIIIGAVIAGLSVGNYLGSVLLGRGGGLSTCMKLGIPTGLYVGILPWIVRAFSARWEGLLPESFPWLLVQLVLDVLLFTAPAIALGAISTVCLRAHSLAHPSDTGALGRGLAWSAAGAVVGALSPYVFFIPILGSAKSLVFCGAMILACSIILRGARRMIPAVVLALAVPFTAGTRLPSPMVGGKILFERESRYGLVRVVEDEEGARRLVFDEGFNVQSHSRVGGPFARDPWSYLSAACFLTAVEPKKVLLLGLGAGTTPAILERLAPSWSLVGVEIDPVVVEAARKHFGMLDLERDGYLRIVVADARQYLKADAGRYDVIILDAYRPPYVPFHLATSEFYRLIRDRLSPDGLVAVNAVRVGRDMRFVEPISLTMQTAFPFLYRVDVPNDFNSILIGRLDPLPRPDSGLLPPPPIPMFAEGLQLVRDGARGRAMTDDHAPVEWLIDGLVLKFAAEGRR